MHKMFNTDFKKLVALILICFLLTNFLTLLIVEGDGNRIIRVVKREMRDIDLYHDRLQGIYCLYADPRPEGDPPNNLYKGKHCISTDTWKRPLKY